MIFTHLAALYALVVSVHGATYHLSDNIVGTDFLNEFTHEAISDPTHGRVYVYLYIPSAHIKISEKKSNNASCGIFSPQKLC